MPLTTKLEALDEATEHNEAGRAPKEPQKKGQRSPITQNACTRCRRKKSKCDGVHPRCGRCQKDGEECEFDPLTGITRMQNLQLQLERRHEENDRISVLYNALRYGSDHLATNLLARLRMGEQLESLTDSLEAMETSPVGQDQSRRQSTVTERVFEADGAMEFEISNDLDFDGWHITTKQGQSERPPDQT